MTSIGASPQNLSVTCPTCKRTKDRVCRINGKNDFALVHPARFELAHGEPFPGVDAHFPNGVDGDVVEVPA